MERRGVRGGRASAEPDDVASQADLGEGGGLAQTQAAPALGEAGGLAQTLVAPGLAGSLSNLGTVAGAEGSLAEAERYLVQALEIRRKALGDEHPDVASSLNNLGNVLSDQGMADAAEESFREALRIRERALGAEHPSLSSPLSNLGALYTRRGAHREARGYYAVATLGEEHPGVAQALLQIGESYLAEGARDQAKAYFERAVPILERTLGLASPGVGDALLRLGDLSSELGLDEEARSHYERAVESREQASGEHPGLAEALTRLAELLHRRGEFAAAKPLYARSTRIYEEALGVETAETPLAVEVAAASRAGLARTLGGLGRVEVALGDREAAGRALERALAVHARGEGLGAPLELARTRFALAQWLWSERSERGRALELARLARDGYRELSGPRSELTAVQTWLSEH